MQQKMYGYVRVSTREQNEERQRIALLEMGVPKERIYVDKLSGKDFERPEYKKLLRRLDDQSVLYVKSIDRLGRNYVDLNEQWRRITKEKGRFGRQAAMLCDMPLSTFYKRANQFRDKTGNKH